MYNVTIWSIVLQLCIKKTWEKMRKAFEKPSDGQGFNCTVVETLGTWFLFLMLIQYDKIPFLGLFFFYFIMMFCVCYCCPYPSKYMLCVCLSGGLYVKWNDRDYVFYHVLFKSKDELQQMCLWFSDCIRVETHPQSYCLYIKIRSNQKLISDQRTQSFSESNVKWTFARCSVWVGYCFHC